MTTLQSFDSILSTIRDEHGPCVIAPPTDPQSPVAILLPLTIRYCVICQCFKPVAAMLTLNMCQACALVQPPPGAAENSD